MAESEKPRIVGLNHIALEVGDIDEALAFYGRLFKFELRGKSDSMAFIDLGDQFIALQKGRKQPADDGRHFGLVVEDKEVARKALKAAGVALWMGVFLTSVIPGATGSRLLAMTTSSSPKLPMCCVAWASIISRKMKKRKRN
jgi:predicted enzyme related to lactoylglutathione lyase